MACTVYASICYLCTKKKYLSSHLSMHCCFSSHIEGEERKKCLRIMWRRKWKEERRRKKRRNVAVEEAWRTISSGEGGTLCSWQMFAWGGWEKPRVYSLSASCALYPLYVCLRRESDCIITGWLGRAIGMGVPGAAPRRCLCGAFSLFWK